MNLNKDPESWAAVSPDDVLAGSVTQARNVIIMALQDIARLANEVERLRAERDEARRREREWHDASVSDRTELHALKSA